MEREVKIPVGDISLEGLMALPNAEPRVGVVICHPHPLYGGDMHNNVVAALTEAALQAGGAALRFNFRGVGGSTGLHDAGDGEQDDVRGATSHLLAHVSPPIVIVAGYSFGATVGLRAGAADPRVHALIGVALPLARRDASFLEGITKPKLLISGDRDDVSPMPSVEALFTRLDEPKQLVGVTGADHFFAGLEGKVAAAALRFIEGLVGQS